MIEEIPLFKLKGKMLAGTGYDVRNDFKKFINATFVWWSNGDPYPLSPLISEGDHLSDNILVGGNQMPMFVIYKNGTCKLDIMNPKDNENIWLAAGGIGLDPINFTGFKESNINSLDYETSRIGIGYNPKTNKVALIAHNNSIDLYSFAYKLRKLGLTNLMCLDSGGSAQFRFERLSRVTQRKMIGWLYWE